MNRAILGREWRAVRETFGYALAALVGLSMTFRIVDEVILVGIFSGLLAIRLGLAIGGVDRSERVREFLFTLPVRRDRFAVGKLLLGLGLLNAFTGAMIAIVLLDLPNRLYGLVAETTIGERRITVDFPIWYPFVLVASSFLLLFVVHVHAFHSSRHSAGSLGFFLLLLLCLGAAGAVHRWPRAWLGTSLGGAAAGIVAVGLYYRYLVRRFVRLEITGGPTP